MSYNEFFKQAKAAKSAQPKSLSEAQIEAELRKAFGMQANPAKPTAKNVSKKMKKKSLPLYSMFSIAAMTAGLFSYLLAPDFFNGHLSRVEIGFLGEAAASGSGQKSTPPKVEAKEKSAATGVSDKGPETGAESEVVSEDTSYFSKLRERKEQLDLREAELNQLEEELQRQKAEIEQRIGELSQIRKDIATTLEDRVQADEGKVKKLVDLYSTMKPKQAADVIATIELDLAVQVLANMKKKSAADIMNVLPAEKAKELSERLTGYRRGTASTR